MADHVASEVKSQLDLVNGGNGGLLGSLAPSAKDIAGQLNLSEAVNLKHAVAFYSDESPPTGCFFAGFNGEVHLLNGSIRAAARASISRDEHGVGTRRVNILCAGGWGAPKKDDGEADAKINMKVILSTADKDGMSALGKVMDFGTCVVGGVKFKWIDGGKWKLKVEAKMDNLSIGTQKDGLKPVVNASLFFSLGSDASGNSVKVECVTGYCEMKLDDGSFIDVAIEYWAEKEVLEAQKPPIPIELTDVLTKKIQTYKEMFKFGKKATAASIPLLQDVPSEEGVIESNIFTLRVTGKLRSLALLTGKVPLADAHTKTLKDEKKGLLEIMNKDATSINLRELFIKIADGRLCLARLDISIDNFQIANFVNVDFLKSKMFSGRLIACVVNPPDGAPIEFHLLGLCKLDEKGEKGSRGAQFSIWVEKNTIRRVLAEINQEEKKKQ